MGVRRIIVKQPLLRGVSWAHGASAVIQREKQVFLLVYHTGLRPCPHFFRPPPKEIGGRGGGGRASIFYVHWPTDGGGVGGKEGFFGLGPPFLGWVGGCFSLFLSYFFGTRSVWVWVGKRFFGALACVTHLFSSEGEEEEEEEKGTTDVASSDGAGLTNPPSQKQFE